MISFGARAQKNLRAQIFMLFLIFDIEQSYAIAVGDSYGGGTVFCISQTADLTECTTAGNGDYGLIMANEDQVNFDSNLQHGVTWSNTHKEIGSSAHSADHGEANTAAIVIALLKDTPNNNAAWACRMYKDPTEWHTDWYLPSKRELNKMYVYAKTHNLIGRECLDRKPHGVQCLLGGHSDNYKAYWSSTEYHDYNNGSASWYQNFSNGTQYYGDKTLSHLGVRAIRSFNDSAIQHHHKLVLSYALNNIRNQLMQIFIDNIEKHYPDLIKLNNASITLFFQKLEQIFKELLNNKKRS